MTDQASNITCPRCAWVPLKDSLYTDYHDLEWGVPVYDDRLLFEFLLLEGFQAGLSWGTILHKRENFRSAFDQFDAEKIAQYGESKIAELLSNAGIIRNRLKVRAAVINARAFLDVQQQYGSFATYLWGFVGDRPIQNAWTTLAEIPARTAESDRMSKELLKLGFKFVGSTICYAHMQATGMVNDHTTDCFRYTPIKAYDSPASSTLGD
jgi:DNA-3-methyladenine glycosylase I